MTSSVLELSTLASLLFVMIPKTRLFASRLSDRGCWGKPQCCGVLCTVVSYRNIQNLTIFKYLYDSYSTFYTFTLEMIRLDHAFLLRGESSFKAEEINRSFGATGYSSYLAL